MHQMAAMKMMMIMMMKKNSLSPRMSSSSLTPPTSSSSSSSTASPSSLPVRAIPGSYGLPLIGSIPDRLDYYWFQGPETFFRKKMDKYKSSVFRTNIPPSFPFFGNVNPNMIAVLDCKSFAHLFDMDVVEKKDVLIGDFMPSVSFTGNMRVGIYRDTSEPQHAQVKNFSIDILKRSSRVWVSELLSNVDIMWATVEKDVSAGGKAMLIPPLQRFLFRFLTKVLMGADPKNSPEIDENGPLMLTKWLAIQIIPTQKVGILQPLEELLLHSFAYPFALVSGDYNKLYEFVKKEGKEVVERGTSEFGLTKEETIHNLLFILGFNAFGGFSVFLPSLFGKLGEDKTGLQDKLREEVRQKSTSASSLSFDSVKEMELVKSFVYEVLRFSPPVPAQYARARKDFVLSSHDSAYQIKKGELLCGYQMLVMRDPNVFDNPESFDPYRFTKEKGGEELLSYLYWSNGPQTGTPSSSNKQCSAKDSVVLTTCLLIADLFWRYDSIKVDGGSITAVQKPAK